MSPLTEYDTIAPNLEINEIHFRHIDPDVHADSRYRNGIDRSRIMSYELWAPENEGRVLLQHKVCISVTCEMCCPIWASVSLPLKIWKKQCCINPKLSCICTFTLHIATNVQTSCLSKTSPSFSGTHSWSVSRSINTMFVPQSACTSESICRKRISFISRFGAIISHFVRGDILFDSPCIIKVSSSTSNVAVLGELGRYLPHVYYYLKCINFWLSIVHDHSTRLWNSLHYMLMNLYYVGKHTWASEIKLSLYIYIDMGLVMSG